MPHTKLQEFVLITLVWLSFACTAPNPEAKAESEPVVATTLPPKKFTEEEIRKRREVQARMLVGENHHDGSLALTHIGDIESVPALIRVLKDNPPSKNGTMICTAAHALTALRTLTQANPGITHDHWQAWWDEHQKAQQSAN